MSIDLVYDNLDVTGKAPIQVEAKICLLPTEVGGKARPITHGYRPNHNFGHAENRHMFIGQIELDKGEHLRPGETRDLLVTFMNVRGLAKHLVVGNEWRIQEGMRLIGTGTVIRIVNPDVLSI